MAVQRASTLLERTYPQPKPVIQSPDLGADNAVAVDPDDGLANGLEFLAGDGEMARLTRAHNWVATPLGPAWLWPQPLRTVIRLILNTRHPMFVFWGPTLACFYNDAFSASIGPERHPDALGRPGPEVWGEIWDTIGPQIAFVMSGSGGTWHENQLVPITRHGRREDAYWTYSYSPINDEAAATKVGGALLVCAETTMQVRVEQQLAARVTARTAEHDRLARLFEHAPSFMAILNGPEHRFDLANQAYLRLIGNRDVLGRTVSDALPEVAEQGYLAQLDDVFQSGVAFRSNGSKYVLRTTPDGPGEERFLDFIYQPVTDEDGAVTGIFIEGSDVTDRVLAETALRDLNESLEQRATKEITARRQNEDALRLAQRMEAVGRLTGGIAHDFNNMLQAVMAGIELAQRHIVTGRGEGSLEFLDGARDAAVRAGALSQRLLAFGRPQAQDPAPVALGDLIHGLESLVRRAVGAAIEVELRLKDDCWLVFCDASQLENALLNLVINGRDAMRAHGGQLRIETAHAVLDEAGTGGWHGAMPGEYVRITVSDTGIGMPPEVMARAFEPFFTTKASGQGTGLGLSQLFGFVRASAGVVRLESTVGAGTSVQVYLPRCRDIMSGSGDAAKTKAQQWPVAAAVTATVLLVDDEVSIREFAAEALQDLGYRVIEAGDATAALDALQAALIGPNTERISLLVTDVGLPGRLNGRQLADAARVLVAELPVLLITGYAYDALDGKGQLAPGMEVLGKPFELAALAWRVHKMIDRPHSV